MKGIWLQVFLPAMVFALFGALAQGSEREDSGERQAPVGRWSTGGSLIEVTRTESSLSARLIALKHPLYREKDRRGEIGKERLDHLNPDPELQSRLLLGLELFSDFEFHNGRWTGTIYSPDSGRTFNARMWVKSDELHIRAFVLGLPWLGRGRSLVSISTCDEDILKMIDRSGITDSVCTGH